MVVYQILDLECEGFKLLITKTYPCNIPTCNIPRGVVFFSAVKLKNFREKMIFFLFWFKTWIVGTC